MSIVDRTLNVLRGKLNKRGQEVLSAEPVAVNCKLSKAQSEFDRVKAFLQSSQFAELCKATGMETPEEALDFDIDDDNDMDAPTLYEVFSVATDLARQKRAQIANTVKETPPGGVAIQEEEQPGGAAPSAPPQS